MAAVSITAGNAIRITLLVAVTSLLLKSFSNATGLGAGLSRYLP